MRLCEGFSVPQLSFQHICLNNINLHNSTYITAFWPDLYPLLDQPLCFSPVYFLYLHPVNCVRRLQQLSWSLTHMYLIRTYSSYALVSRIFRSTFVFPTPIYQYNITRDIYSLLHQKESQKSEGRRQVITLAPGIYPVENVRLANSQPQ